MSCVWNSLLVGLKRGGAKIKFKPDPVDLVMYLKEHNKITENITVNGEELSKQQLKENKEAIKELNKTVVSTGYWCSTCDPVLILFCEVFEVSIVHNYLSSTINYNHHSPKFIMCLSSNKGHMTFKNILSTRAEIKKEKDNKKLKNKK